MARRIQRKELKKPDDFVDAGGRVLGWISDHRAVLGIAVAGALVLLFGVMLVIHLRRSADVEAWRPVLDAVPVRALPVDGDQANPLEMLGRQDPAVWVDAQRIKQVAESGDEDGPRAVAGLALAGELLAQGDGAAAEARYRAYLATGPRQDAAGRLVAQEGLGYALERQDKQAEAAQAFAALAELDQGAYKALALYHQGRLALLDGRDDEARRLLLEAKGIQDPRPKDLGAQIESWLRRIELRTLPVVEPATEPVPPTVEPVEPVVEPATEPVPPTVEPVEPVVEPAGEPGAEAAPAAPAAPVPEAPEAPQADERTIP
ncbi:MAG: hypothetical protein JXB32_14015 [Deltaproteobacteria bacterium]|nr:hypothetical protein [Deltaproteobacteria bacterium]